MAAILRGQVEAMRLSRLELIALATFTVALLCLLQLVGTINLS